MTQNAKKVNYSDLGIHLKKIVSANLKKVMSGKNHKESFKKDTYTDIYLTMRKHSSTEIAITKQFKSSSGIPMEDKHWLVNVAS